MDGESIYMHTNNSTRYNTTYASKPRRITCNNLPLAQVYVKSQPYEHLNSPSKTLIQGTFFADLYDPYKPRRYAQGGRRHE